MKKTEFKIYQTSTGSAWIVSKRGVVVKIFGSICEAMDFCGNENFVFAEF